MAVTVKADTSELAKLPELIEATIKETHDQVAAGAEQLANRITERVRADVTQAGNFGTRWTEGFKVKVSADDPKSVSIAGGFEEIPYWRVFQYGATIHGKPFLWFKPKEGSVSNKKGFALAKTPTVIKVRQVTIPKKFHVVEIIEEEAQRAGQVVNELKLE